MKKVIFKLLLVLILVCFCAVTASATIQGELGTMNVIWSDSLSLTAAGQATTYQLPAQTYLMSMTLSSKLSGQTVYVSATEGVELMINSEIIEPVDGWYILAVKSLPGRQFALVNWNDAEVVLTMQTMAPACKHSETVIKGYAPTCTATGLTDGKTCTICGETTLEQETIPALGHSYEQGKCVNCGGEDPNPSNLLDIDVARMILGNSLEFQFGITATKLPDTTGYYAIIEKCWADGTVTQKTIPADSWGLVGPYFAIVYDSLAAKEMADTFYVTIYDGDHVQVTNTREDSVRDYVNRAYSTQEAFGKTMMVDMLNYGAAAQEYFEYNTADLANNQLTGAQQVTGTMKPPIIENNVIKGKNYVASRFILKSSIQVQLAFSGLTEDMYAVYTYIDNKGLNRAYRIEGKDFVVSDGKLAGVELSKLVYADARCLVNVTIYNADGTVYGTASDSIESCCQRSTTGNDVFLSLMKFADSAKIYLHNK